MTFNDVGRSLLLASNITVRRGNETLFKPLTFNMQSGEMVWLRGPNGSGKTSLMRVIAGLAEPDSGTLRWPALDASSGRENALKPLVYLGHHNGLKDDLTALESLQFLADLHGRDGSVSACGAAMRRLGIYHRRHLPVRTLSQGQRKRVALARLALETQASLWVLDEPFDALDDAGIATVGKLLKEHAVRGGSVLLTSHIVVAIDGLQSREMTLEKGFPRGAAT